MRIVLCTLKFLRSGVLNLIDDLLEFVSLVLDLFWHWRFSLCLAIGLALGVAAYIVIGHDWLRAVAFLGFVASSLFVGWRWDRSA